MKNKKINNIDYLKLVSYVYIILPAIIFIGGWTKSFIGGPLVILLLISIYLMSKSTNSYNFTLGNTRKKYFILVLSVMIILVWVFFSGIGGFVWQNRDHYWRNTIFDLLVNESWPVVINNQGMSYYIGFWMVPAVVGKVFGLGIGYFAQFIWAALGVLVVFLLISRNINKLSIWPLIIFIFFSGLDFCGIILVNRGYPEGFLIGTHIEWWADFCQFSGITTQLYWVFNQAIYGWIITLLVLEEKNNNIILLMACGLLSATFPMVGLFPIAVLRMHNNVILSTKNPFSIIKYIITLIKSALSFPNVVGVLCSVIMISIFSGNSAVGSTASFFISIPIRRYIIFIAMEIGLYIVLTFKNNFKNRYYILAIVILVICPFIRIGSGGDFCMRASIPSLLILYIAVVKTMNEYFSNRKNILGLALVVVLMLGSFTTVNEFARTYQNIGIPIEKCSMEEIMYAENFSSDVNNNLFYKYFAKY